MVVATSAFLPVACLRAPFSNLMQSVYQRQNLPFKTRSVYTLHSFTSRPEARTLNLSVWNLL